MASIVGHGGSCMAIMLMNICTKRDQYKYIPLYTIVTRVFNFEPLPVMPPFPLAGLKT